MPAQAQPPWLLMAQPVSQLSIRRDSRPSSAHAAHLVPLLSNAWVFCYRTKTVTLCVTRAPWPARSARATPACADLMRDSVFSPKVPTQPRKTMDIRVARVANLQPLSLCSSITPANTTTTIRSIPPLPVVSPVLCHASCFLRMAMLSCPPLAYNCRSCAPSRPQLLLDRGVARPCTRVAQVRP